MMPGYPNEPRSVPNGSQAATRRVRRAHTIFICTICGDRAVRCLCTSKGLTDTAKRAGKDRLKEIEVVDLNQLRHRYEALSDYLAARGFDEAVNALANPEIRKLFIAGELEQLGDAARGRPVRRAELHPNSRSAQRGTPLA